MVILNARMCAAAMLLGLIKLICAEILSLISEKAPIEFMEWSTMLPAEVLYSISSVVILNARMCVAV